MYAYYIFYLFLTYSFYCFIMYRKLTTNVLVNVFGLKTTKTLMIYIICCVKVLFF